MADEPTARVEIRHGELVLVDPEAEALFAAVAAQNRSNARKSCLQFLRAQEERMLYFAGRISARGMTPAEAIITYIQVDDPHGGSLRRSSCPGTTGKLSGTRDESRSS